MGNNPQARGVFGVPDFLTPNQEGMFRDSRIIAQLALRRNLKTSQVSRYWFIEALRFMKRNPRAYLKLLMSKFILAFNPKEFISEAEFHLMNGKIRIFKIMFLDLSFILPLAFLGMFTAVKKFREILSLYLIVATFFVNMLVFFVHTKLRIAAVPYLIVFAAFGIFRIAGLLQQKRYRQAGFLIGACFVFFVAFNFDALTKKEDIARKLALPDYRYHFEKSIMYEQKKDFPAALAELLKADSIKPHYHRIQFALGATYYEMGDERMAEEKFKEAIGIFPFYLDAYYNLGLLYNNQKRFDEALSVLKEGLFLEPEDVGVRFELAKAYKGRGDFKQARAELKTALERLRSWQYQEKQIIEKELESSEP